jgi:hypothetical protein
VVSPAVAVGSSRRPGQGEKDLVEGGPSQADVVHLDLEAAKCLRDRSDRSPAARNGYRRTVGVQVEVGFVGADRCQCLCHHR